MKDQNELEELLLKALKKEPELGLPLGFSVIVTRKIFAKSEKLKTALMAILYGVIICSGLTLSLFVFNPELTYQLLSIFASGKFIIATVIAGILMVQYLDQRFVKS